MGKERESERERERGEDDDAATSLGLFRSLCSFVELKLSVGLFLRFFLSIKNSADFVV